MTAIKATTDQLLARQNTRTSKLEALQDLRQRLYNSPREITKVEMLNLICQQIDALYE